MPESQYLARTPLLDPRQQVVGYRLAWQRDPAESLQTRDADLLSLLECVAERVKHTTSGLIFLNASPAMLSAGALQALSPSHTVLTLNREDFLAVANSSLVAYLRKQGFSLALRDVNLEFLKTNQLLLRFISYIELGVDQPELEAIAVLARNSLPDIALVVDQPAGWEAIDRYAQMGIYGFFGQLCETPRKLEPRGAIGPQAGLILKLMQMVQENADVRQLEAILKRDAALSFKLFRYINSASFGVRVEIQSLRHAVTMMGYMPLFRWLSALLATTSTTGYSPALLQAAMARGRFAELLGQGSLTKNEAENLFFVGMFSLLDQLLGIPMREVLGQISLPEPVAQALLTQEGVFAPFLALTRACEQQNEGAAAIAEALFITPARVNQAHMSALAWAQNLQP